MATAAPSTSDTGSAGDDGDVTFEDFGQKVCARVWVTGTAALRTMQAEEDSYLLFLSPGVAVCKHPQYPSQLPRGYRYPKRFITNLAQPPVLL